MDNSWVVDNLQRAFSTWNDRMEEIWSLLTQSPETFKDGAIWNAMVGINGALQAIGYGLLVLFFAINLFRSAASFRDFQRPEYAVRHLIQFILAKTAITYGLEFLTKIFAICNGVVATAAGSVGGIDGASITMPDEIINAINDVGFWHSIPLWLITLMGTFFITILAFIMILTVYGRFFKLYMYAALSPIALSSFVGSSTSFIGKSFLKSYIGVCMEGAVIVLACIIFTAFASSGAPPIAEDVSVVTQVWTYLAETVFNLLILVGLTKTADRIVKEMFGV